MQSIGAITPGVYEGTYTNTPSLAERSGRGRSEWRFGKKWNYDLNIGGVLSKYWNYLGLHAGYWLLYISFSLFIALTNHLFICVSLANVFINPCSACIHQTSIQCLHSIPHDTGIIHVYHWPQTNNMWRQYKSVVTVDHAGVNSKTLTYGPYERWSLILMLRFCLYRASCTLLPTLLFAIVNERAEDIQYMKCSRLRHKALRTVRILWHLFLRRQVVSYLRTNSWEMCCTWEWRRRRRGRRSVGRAAPHPRLHGRRLPSPASYHTRRMISADGHLISTP